MSTIIKIERHAIAGTPYENAESAGAGSSNRSLRIIALAFTALVMTVGMTEAASDLFDKAAGGRYAEEIFRDMLR
ncbi:hypothetical protein [Allosphingosinicella vermicomposti]|uniref:hypothetical protein n=1 Tax=Allosphingosinicella vermicomposti TaxID=614671 RepID=UPI000D0EEC59|nr:hypothetical protein [Allosphingosinicella vermicomposti]